MRKLHKYRAGMALTLLIILLPLSGLVSCASLASGPLPLSNGQTIIDWVDFIRFNGITYIAKPPEPGHSLVENDLGPVFATIAFKLDGNVHDPHYQSKDGDAAFLDVGTKIYSVKGYHSTFRLAAYADHILTLYEADTNFQTRKITRQLALFIENMGSLFRQVEQSFDQEGWVKRDLIEFF